MSLGTNQNVSLNPVCIASGVMTEGGWYMFPQSMTGTIFGIYSFANGISSFREVMLYSQEAIQMKALSAVATNLHASFPASNAL